jgi:hypothetical protein
MEPGQRPQHWAATEAFHAGGGSLLVGDGITDDTLLHIARFLTATDLLRLGLTAARFSTKGIAVPFSPTGGAEWNPHGPATVAIADEMASIVEVEVEVMCIYSVTYQLFTTHVLVRLGHPKHRSARSLLGLPPPSACTAFIVPVAERPHSYTRSSPVYTLRCTHSHPTPPLATRTRARFIWT